MSPSIEHIVSRGAYGEVGNGSFERMRERDHEIWFGSDGSGLISETFIRSSFFRREQEIRWAETPHRITREDPTPSVDLFAPAACPGPLQASTASATNSGGSVTDWLALNVGDGANWSSAATGANFSVSVSCCSTPAMTPPPERSSVGRPISRGAWSRRFRPGPSGSRAALHRQRKRESDRDRPWLRSRARSL